jgi:hypothetical protein
VAIEDRLAAAGVRNPLLGNTSEDRSKEERLLRTMQEISSRWHLDLSYAA